MARSGFRFFLKMMINSLLSCVSRVGCWMKPSPETFTNSVTGSLKLIRSLSTMNLSKLNLKTVMQKWAEMGKRGPDRCWASNAGPHCCCRWPDNGRQGQNCCAEGSSDILCEWPDNYQGNVLSLLINKDTPFTTEFIPSLLNGTQVIRTTGYQTKKTLDRGIEKLAEELVTLIPYALWNNRGPGQMMVWLPVLTESTHPLPALLLPFGAK